MIAFLSFRKIKPKRPQNDSYDNQLTLWEDFFGQ